MSHSSIDRFESDHLFTQETYLKGIVLLNGDILELNRPIQLVFEHFLLRIQTTSTSEKSNQPEVRIILSLTLEHTLRSSMYERNHVF